MHFLPNLLPLMLPHGLVCLSSFPYCRISAVREPGSGAVVGLTYRLGRHVPGVAAALADVLSDLAGRGRGRDGEPNAASMAGSVPLRLTNSEAQRTACHLNPSSPSLVHACHVSYASHTLLPHPLYPASPPRPTQLAAAAWPPRRGQDHTAPRHRPLPGGRPRAERGGGGHKQRDCGCVSGLMGRIGA